MSFYSEWCWNDLNDVGMRDIFHGMSLIFLIPRPSLSFWVILKCLFCHSMVILRLNDLRVNEMMIEWPFSHPRMMNNDSNEGEMMKFLKQGKCPRFFSLSFHPHFNHISSFDTHSMTEMSCHIGRHRILMVEWSEWCWNERIFWWRRYDHPHPLVIPVILSHCEMSILSFYGHSNIEWP